MPVFLDTKRFIKGFYHTLKYVTNGLLINLIFYTYLR